MVTLVALTSDSHGGSDAGRGSSIGGSARVGSSVAAADVGEHQVTEVLRVSLPVIMVNIRLLKYWE